MNSIFTIAFIVEKASLEYNLGRVINLKKRENLTVFAFSLQPRLGSRIEARFKILMKNSFLIEHKKAPIRKKSIALAILTGLFIFGFFFQNNIQKVLAVGLWDKVQGLDGKTGLLSDVGPVFGGNQKDVRAIVIDAIKVFLTFLGLIFLILIILAGWKYMMARGDDAKVTEAISQIQHAIIGLIIILAAYAITDYVFNVISNNVLTE